MLNARRVPLLVAPGAVDRERHMLDREPGAVNGRALGDQIEREEQRVLDHACEGAQA